MPPSSDDESEFEEIEEFASESEMNLALAQARALDGDVLSLIFRHLPCTYTLFRCMAVSRRWRESLRRGSSRPAADVWRNAWLSVPVLDAAGRLHLSCEEVLRRAPAGERILIRAGTVLRGQVHCPSHLHVAVEPNGPPVTIHGQLLLEGTAHPPRGSLLECSPDRGEVGLVEGPLLLSHFDQEACLVLGGSWRLSNCTVASSRRGRASAAFVVRNGSALALAGCTVNDATRAVCLERWPCQLHASECAFTNLREAIYTRGGGIVEVARSSFEETEIGLKLDDDTRGGSRHNTFGEGTSCFGRWARPRGFLCVGNTYAAGSEEAAANEHSGEGGSGGGGGGGDAGSASADGTGGPISAVGLARAGGGAPPPPGASAATPLKLCVAGPTTAWVQCDLCNKWRRMLEEQAAT